MERRTLRLSLVPDDAPERWELTVEQTREVLLSGSLPVDLEAVRIACRVYWQAQQTDVDKVAKLIGALRGLLEWSDDKIRSLENSTFDGYGVDHGGTAVAQARATLLEMDGPSRCSTS
jgi:hypothetical protein